MKLTLVSNQPLDQTLSQALQYFNEVPNRNRLPMIFPGEPYASSTYMVILLKYH
jgi:secreted Zn-dependent insulinase-like peptidase